VADAELAPYDFGDVHPFTAPHTAQCKAVVNLLHHYRYYVKSRMLQMPQTKRGGGKEGGERRCDFGRLSAGVALPTPYFCFTTSSRAQPF
jgi:hypothetical protein